jgi:OOP family OmpA-OmpF porin
VAGYLFNSDKNQDDEIGYQIGFEIPFTDHLSASVMHSEVESDVLNSALDTDVSLLHGGINYNFDQIRSLQPYIGVGIGKYRFENTAGSDFDRESLDINAGVKYFFSNNWMGKFEAMMVQPGGSLDEDYLLSLSIGYVFGSRNGRPAPAPMARSNPEPAPAAPAPRDSDGDGVIDANDACPNTNRNLAVDARGCVILDDEQRNQTLAVKFDFDQSLIKDEYQDEIEEFAEFMREYNNTSATIEGHTDSRGSEAYNQALSERRANAVRNELIMRYGIAASRLRAVGFGESQPIASNDTDAGRAQNRRIDADVIVTVQVERRR